MNADSGAPCSPRHLKKKHFMEGIKRGLGPHASSKQLTESAAVACVKLCKASTYINIADSSNVTFHLVQSVINELKVTDSETFDVISFFNQSFLFICLRHCCSTLQSHLHVVKALISRTLNS